MCCHLQIDGLFQAAGCSKSGTHRRNRRYAGTSRDTRAPVWYRVGAWVWLFYVIDEYTNQAILVSQHLCCSNNSFNVAGFNLFSFDVY